MQHLELNAPDEMKDQVQGLWYLERDFGSTPAAFEVLPDGHAEIIFHFGSGLILDYRDQRESLPSPFVVGLLGQTIHFYAKDRLKLLGVKCYPWAVYDLLNLPPVKGGVVGTSEHPIASLQDEIASLLEEGKIADALALVKNWFLERKAWMSTNSLLSKAGRAMLKDNGASRVTDVAEAAHSTIRTLERKFKASSGHTVKDVSGLMRFERARDRLWCAPDTAISGLAHELGYADQSHLNREFKRYSGITAAAFAKQAKVRKEMLGDDFVAIVLSSQV